MTLRGDNSAKDSAPMSPSRNLYGKENLAAIGSAVETVWNMAGNSDVHG